jgi:mono/diheme cytochrome c family protein
MSTQTWYYPSPADCLTCHTPAANYVLGVKTRQLDGTFSYPNAVTDNQLRTLNRAGLFYPAIDESSIASYTHLVAVTNQSGTLVDRARSYIDANCAQCHRPNGSGPSFDARWDTALTNQNLINGPLAKGDLGYDHAYVVVPQDIWRSILYQRADSLDPAVKMPPLARNVIDTNSLAVVAAWINSLPGGLPALAPPVLNPAGGTFQGSVQVTIQPPNTNAAIYFTLDGTLPTNTSSLYTGPLVLTNTLTLRANVFEPGFTNSVAAGDLFTILPGVNFVGLPSFSNGVFQTQLSVEMGKSYIFQASTNLSTWISLSTNSPLSSPFNLVDPAATNFPFRFYRAVQQP